MKKISKIMIIHFVLFILVVPIHTFAKTDTEINIVNHFSDQLSFSVGINPQVVPDLPSEFLLSFGDKISSRVLDINKEAYIRVIDKNNHKAFWGVEIVNNKLKFHGYIGKGIAFNWRGNIITFCTPEEYQQNRGCI